MCENVMFRARDYCMSLEFDINAMAFQGGLTKTVEMMILQCLR